MSVERCAGESLALWEQAEDDEFRSSLVECMDALDEYAQEDARLLWLSRMYEEVIGE